MRILFFVQGLVNGGAERLMLDVCIELNKRKSVEYLLVGFSDVNQYKELSQQVPYHVCVASIELSLLKRNQIHIESLQKIIKDFKPDIIHSNVYLCELLTREKLFPWVKYFTHCHSNMPEFKAFGIKTPFNKGLLTKFYEKKRIEKKYRQCNNQFIVISKDTLNYYSKNLNRSLRKNIHFLANAIDYNKFYNPDKREITDRVNLIMVGHMSDYKNQIFLIDVLKILRNGSINAHLTLLGDWLGNGERINEKAKKAGLSAHLSMPGIVTNVEGQLADQHIYVHSAYYEPFGLVMIEAMASGLPVVCLDGGGNRDIIEEGKNGFMIAEQDPQEFTEKIIELVNNKQLYSDISQYAKTYAMKYDIKQYVDKLLKLYAL